MKPEIYQELSYKLYEFRVSFTGTGDGFEFKFPRTKLRITHNGEKFIPEYKNRAGEYIETVTVEHISTVLLMVEIEAKGLFK